MMSRSARRGTRMSTEKKGAAKKRAPSPKTKPRRSGKGARSRTTTQVAAEGGAAPKLVVMGSSAGGIESLVRVIRDLPGTLNASVVIAQHLGTLRPSFLPTILHGALLVTAAADGQALLPRTVYVAPPDRDLVVERGRLRLLAADEGTRTGRPSIDRLFESAAAFRGS